MEFTSRNLMKKVKYKEKNETISKDNEGKKETSYENETYKLCKKLIKKKKKSRAMHLF